MEVIKKITVKTVTGGVNIIKLVEHQKAAPGTPLWLMEVFGIATSSKPGQTDMGAFVKFIGQFKALNIATGEVKRSGACLLPGALPDLVFGALSAEGNQAVQFGFRIGVKFDDTSATKYVYVCDSLMEVKENDPLELLESGIKKPALTAPQAQPDPAAAAASTQEPAGVANAGGKGRKAA
jgi:hypothetical protein